MVIITLFLHCGDL